MFKLFNTFAAPSRSLGPIPGAKVVVMNRFGTVHSHIHCYNDDCDLTPYEQYEAQACLLNTSFDTGFMDGHAPDGDETCWPFDITDILIEEYVAPKPKGFYHDPDAEVDDCTIIGSLRVDEDVPF